MAPRRAPMFAPTRSDQPSRTPGFPRPAPTAPHSSQNLKTARKPSPFFPLYHNIIPHFLIKHILPPPDQWNQYRNTIMAHIVYNTIFNYWCKWIFKTPHTREKLCICIKALMFVLNSGQWTLIGTRCEFETLQPPPLLCIQCQCIESLKKNRNGAYFSC